MPHNITRREFLRYSAAALASLCLASLLPEPARTVRSAPRQQASTPLPSFQALPAPALLGAPVDVGIGADGVQWVLGASGAPSSYDPLQQAWVPFGGGIDAAAYIPFVDSNGNFSVSLCFFRGGEVYKSGTAGPVPIASLWPNLPPSFQQDVDGATYLNDSVGNTFLLFRQGQVAAVDVWGQVSVALLADYGGMGWPGGAWQDGLFEYVISGKDPAFPGYAIFVRSGEYIVANLAQGLITTAPQPLSAGFGGAAAVLLAQGDIQAVVCLGAVQATDAPLQVFGGPVLYTLENTTSTTPAQAQYLGAAFPGWPAAWHPVLQAAPAGSVGSADSPGNLWSLDQAGTPLWNTGSGWAAMPLPSNTPAASLDVGADGSVFAVAANTLYGLASGAWEPTALPTGALQQVSAGDASHIWVRDAQGNVYRFAGGALTQANLGVAVTDMQANADGTLWHCSASLSNAYRYISEGQQPSETLAIGLGVTGVQKAASSAFGAGFFLAQQGTQNVLIRYTSPYLFKTGSQYAMAGPQQIATGAASIFVFCESPAAGGGWNFFVVALDMHTGGERWRYAYPSSGDEYGYSPLYDAEQQLVYVFQAAGVVQALDAQTGEPRWTLQLPQVIPVQPVLCNGQIYIAAYDNPTVTPNSSMVYLIAVDARAAAQRAGSNQPVVASWTFPYNVPGQQVAPLPPVVFEGSIYGAVWSQANQQLQLSLLQVNTLTGTGSDLFDAQIFGSGTNNGGSSAPIIARLTLQPGETVGALIVNAGTAGIYGIYLDGSGSFLHYSPQALEGNPVLTNFATFGGATYFCDSQGNLYGLDANLDPLPGLPTTFIGGTLDSTGITVMGDENDQAVVIAGDIGSDTLCFYSTANGNLLTLPTNQTAITALSAVTRDGIVYAGGSTTNSLGQVFAIRTSDASSLRDFVIESQLLQDFDPGHLPVARYQTQVMIVDDAKSPQPFTSVKVWADAPLAVQIDGTPYTIGPATPAATQADASGALTIISAATDLFATPLRIWAAFMDPFERIVIYPDREFHGRLPAMIADPTNDDPTTINLATGTNYGAMQIFTDQQQAQAVAAAVATTCQAAGISGSTPSTQARSAGAGASLPPYTAYADLPCMQYTPYNTPASRPALVQGPYGVSWSSDTPATYTGLPFAAAATAIDALAGELDPTLAVPLPAPLGSGFGSIFSDLWHKIKSGVVKVTKVIVSIGNAVYAGIQYVENGVTKVFRFVVRQIEDLAATIGALFVALGKAIEDIIELLSLLLHFEEVVKTHKILKAAILQQINGLPLTGTTIIQPAVKDFFANSEGAITQAFCTVKQQIVPGFTCSAPGVGTSPPVSGMTGIGATAHTIFSATPKTGGSAKSHAVAATWGFDKVRSHYKQATAGSAFQAGAAAGNPILDFVTAFGNSLTTDPALQQAYKTTLNEFAASFAFKSSTQFLQMALFDLLDMIQDLLISSLAIGKAFLEGFLALAGDMVSFLLDPQQGILVQPLDIPILGDLYQWLFDSQLTFLDLIVLVASIPVTFLYRIVEGKWLSEQVAVQTAGQTVLIPQATLTPLARALGLLNVAFFFGRAILMPINDTTSQPGAPNPVTGPLLGAISAGFCATALLKTERASDLIFSITALGLLVAPYFTAAGPAISSFLSLVRIGAFLYDLAIMPSRDALSALSGNVLGSLPALAQPLKYLNNATDDLSLAILVGLELIGNFGAAFFNFFNTAVNWDAVPTALPPSEEPILGSPARLHLPFVQTFVQTAP